MTETLRRAKAEGKPYQVVHFDGHGGYLDMEGLLGRVKEKDAAEERAALARELDLDPRRFSPEALYPHSPRPGRRGYLLFESAEGDSAHRFVDGPELGALLQETGVPVLVLNACRSAHGETAAPADPADPDPHRQVRAWGSLAQEVMDAGAAGVVAMRYNVYVGTAADLKIPGHRGHRSDQIAPLAARRGQKLLPGMNAN